MPAEEGGIGLKDLNDVNKSFFLSFLVGLISLKVFGGGSQGTNIRNLFKMVVMVLIL